MQRIKFCATYVSLRAIFSSKHTKNGWKTRGKDSLWTTTQNLHIYYKIYISVSELQPHRHLFSLPMKMRTVTFSNHLSPIPFCLTLTKIIWNWAWDFLFQQTKSLLAFLTPCVFERVHLGHCSNICNRQNGCFTNCLTGHWKLNPFWYLPHKKKLF